MVSADDNYRQESESLTKLNGKEQVFNIMLQICFLKESKIMNMTLL